MDGLVFVRGRDLRPGDLVPCEILSSEGYDLVARPVEGADAEAEDPAPPEAEEDQRASPFTILPG